MKKLLIICGPTATGKTRLAVHLSRLLNGVVISADSRQIYKYMDIGTGKERPEGVKVLGYDLVRPNEEFSVKNYIDFAYKAIKEVYKEGKLPILVGGTGLYIKAVVDQLKRVYIPRNLELRRQLRDKSAPELLAILMKEDPAFAASFNDSDRANPRRLIRGIEVAALGKTVEIKEEPVNFDSVLWIGLFADKKELDRRINERVKERIEMGFEKEIEFLKRKGFLKSAPAVTLGYKEWIEYLNGKITKDEVVRQWQREEKNYAKRQMVWFKKEKRIDWFDITKSGWMEKVEELAQKWYSLK